jgi:hypothetical protein
MLVTSLNQDNITLIAGGNALRSGTVTIQLTNATPQGGYGAGNWTGTGEYYILLWESPDGNFSGNPAYVTMNKVNFQNETTTVAWSQFSTLPTGN